MLESIILWKELNDIGKEIDVALSFQDSEGCISIW